MHQLSETDKSKLGASGLKRRTTPHCFIFVVVRSTVMEEKLQDILNEYEEQITRYETQITDLEARMQFCMEHKFEEELRIARVKFDSLNMAIYRWRNMHKAIQELLNKWLS